MRGRVCRCAQLIMPRGAVATKQSASASSQRGTKRPRTAADGCDGQKGSPNDDIGSTSTSPIEDGEIRAGSGNRIRRSARERCTVERFVPGVATRFHITPNNEWDGCQEGQPTWQHHDGRSGRRCRSDHVGCWCASVTRSRSRSIAMDSQRLLEAADARSTKSPASATRPTSAAYKGARFSAPAAAP